MVRLGGLNLLVSAFLVIDLAAADTSPSSPAPPVRSDPVTIDISKSGYNLYAAVRAALADQSLADACRLIAEAGPEEVTETLPDLRDDGLFLAYPLWVLRFLQEHPAALEFMRQEYQSVAELRLKTAIEAEDSLAAEAVALRFCGTDAARTALRWLGDRALSAGDFANSLGYYRRAQWAAPTADRQSLQQRLRLAAAMWGRDAAGHSPDAFEYRGEQLPAADFERLVREMIGRKGESVAGTSEQLAAEIVPAPPSAAWEAKLWTKIEFPRPWSLEHRQVEADHDWLARLITATATADSLLLSNSLRLSVVMQDRGKSLWTQPLDANRSGSWKSQGIPFTPLVLADRIFIRRISEQGPTGLVCLDFGHGKASWTSDARYYVVSDAWAFDGVVLAFTMQGHPSGLDTRSSDPRAIWRADKKSGRNLLLQLTAMAPKTGQLVGQYPVAKFRLLGDPLPSCRVVVTDDRVVATVGGLSLCMDSVGRLQWLRKHQRTQVESDASRPRKHHGRPLVAANAERVTVYQPDGATVQCLDVATGALHWEQDAQDLRRLLGIVRERVVAQTDDGFRGFDSNTGAVVWERRVERVCEALACGEPGGLVYAAQEKFDDSTEGWGWVWLDPVDGAVTARRPIGAALLPDKRGAIPRLGPFIQHHSRLFVGCDRGGREHQHREFYELSPVSEPVQE